VSGMHELSIAASVVEIACRHARPVQDGALPQRVSKVHVQVGYLRQVVPAALAFSFELVAQGTAAEGAELELDTVPAVGRCRRCGVESRLRAFPLQCGACSGFDLEIVAGEELVVESLELEDVEDGVASPFGAEARQ